MKNRKRTGTIHSIKTYFIGTVISVMKLAMLCSRHDEKAEDSSGIQKQLWYHMNMICRNQAQINMSKQIKKIIRMICTRPSPV